MKKFEKCEAPLDITGGDLISFSICAAVVHPFEFTFEVIDEVLVISAEPIADRAIDVFLDMDVHDVCE